MIVYLIPLMTLLCQVTLADDLNFEEAPVVSLSVDPKDFDTKVKQYPFILVEFYSPLCIHCQHLLPTYHAAAKELAKENPPIHLGAVNVLQYP